MKLRSLIIASSSLALSGVALGSQLSQRLETTHERHLENRREVLSSLSDPFGIPQVARVVLETKSTKFRDLSAWKRNIISTVFWIGELPTEHNPTPNTKSAWDQNWQQNFGGYDRPDKRDGFLPEGFVPSLNPFYIALPYNDVAKGGVHRPEASDVIPWFWESYQGDGISVCKGHWLAIHHDGKVCFAQWEDVGPFEVDHWQYVFGKEEPRANRNQSAGIDLSPAVRDFLNLKSGAMVEWRFTDARDVPNGPWKSWDRAAGLPLLGR
jgi:hypothetical protein